MTSTTHTDIGAKNSAFKHSFTVWTTDNWNQLEEDIITEDNPQSFKERLKCGGQPPSLASLSSHHCEYVVGIFK